MAKITAGMAEAGGTETKQSQERGVSGLRDVIWGRGGVSVFLMRPLHHPGQETALGSPPPST